MADVDAEQIPKNTDGKKKTDDGTKAKAKVKQPRIPRVRAIWGISYIKRKFQKWKAEREKETPEQKAARRTATATRWIAAFTIVLAGVGIFTLYQVIEGGKDNTEAMRLDQRAWVYVKSCALSREPEIGEGFTVDCRVENTGKTPAVSIRDRFVTGSSNVPPRSPDWNQIPSEASFILFPGDTGRGFLTRFVIHDGPPAQRGAELNSILAYRRSINRIWVWSHLTYEDVFGGIHFTDSCMYRVFGTGLADFMACDFGNSIDRNQQNPN